MELGLGVGARPPRVHGYHCPPAVPLRLATQLRDLRHAIRIRPGHAAAAESTVHKTPPPSVSPRSTRASPILSMSRVHAPQPASPGVRCAAATGSIASLHAFHVAFYQRQSACRLALFTGVPGALDSGGAGGGGRFTCSSPLDAGWCLGGCLRSSSFTHQALASFCPACGGGPWRGDKPTCGFRSWHCPPPLSLALLLLRFLTFVARLSIFLILLSVGFEFDGTDNEAGS